MKSIGHPLISDDIYSGGKAKIKSYHVKHTTLLKKVIQAVPRVALHAKEIEIFHPENNKKISFAAALPEDMKKALKILNNHENI